MDLAIATGIPPSVWADEGERSIVTAIRLIEEQAKKQRSKSGSRSGQQTSG